MDRSKQSHCIAGRVRGVIIERKKRSSRTRCGLSLKCKDTLKFPFSGIHKNLMAQLDIIGSEIQKNFVLKGKFQQYVLVRVQKFWHSTDLSSWSGKIGKWTNSFEIPDIYNADIIIKLMCIDSNRDDQCIGEASLSINKLKCEGHISI